jgi:hypothetical protein
MRKLQYSTGELAPGTLDIWKGKLLADIAFCKFWACMTLARAFRTVVGQEPLL